MKRKAIPTFDALMDPTLKALKRLGGSGSIDELVQEIVRIMNLPQDVADIPHGGTGRTELESLDLKLLRNFSCDLSAINRRGLGTERGQDPNPAF